MRHRIPSRRTALAACVVGVALALSAPVAQAAWVSYQAPYRNNPYLTAGTTFKVTWGEIQSPTSTDWIGLFPENAPDSGYITWVYTTGTASGETKMTIPRDAPYSANYQLRMFANNSSTRLGLPAGLSLAPPWQFRFTVGYPRGSTIDVHPGDKIRPHWEGVLAPSPTDWVGLYLKGKRLHTDNWAPSTSYITWKYTDGSSTGSTKIKLPKTLRKKRWYEVRMFSNNSLLRISRPRILFYVD
jgi:hypothetical protein